MRLPRFENSREVSFNMTPMIDVVFLLIIFFLVSSHLAKQEAQMELPLPVAESGEEPVEHSRLTLNVLQDGSMLLAGRSVTPDQLRQRLAAARDAEGEALEIRIRGNREVAYRHISPILLSCAKSGIWNVTFAVHRPEDVR